MGTDVQGWPSRGVGKTLGRIGTPEDDRTNADPRDKRETFFPGRGLRIWIDCCAGCKGVLFPCSQEPQLGQHAPAVRWPRASRYLVRQTDGR